MRSARHLIKRLATATRAAFPTGAVLAPERRLALREWARDCGGLIIEDDYDAELRYDREPVGALQGLVPDQVIYCGSTSKSLGRGLRIGWRLCSPDLAEEIVEEKRAEGRGSPILEQLTFARLLATGRFDRHLRRVRSRCRSRRDALAHALARFAPQVGLTGRLTLTPGGSAHARLRRPSPL